MNTEREKAELEIACQQIVLSDASVYSVQWLDFPACCAPQVTAPLLLERYFNAVRACTCHLVRPSVTEEGVKFRVLGTPLVLLSFSPPQFQTATGEALSLSIRGGFLVQAAVSKRGEISLCSETSEKALRITVQLTDYCPLLLGSAKPSRLRKLFYRITQAYLHKVVTVRYLSYLHRELTGMNKRVRVKKVQLRQGIET